MLICMMNKFILLLLSFFNLGKVRFAPGTLASIFTAIIWYNIPNIITIQISLIVIIIIISSFLCFYYNMNIKKDDPSFIVLDEFCGMSISLFMLPKTYILFFVSFLIFRFFDIFKPLYINESQKIKYGIGIMVDDILSGLYTLAIMNFILFFYK